MLTKQEIINQLSALQNEDYITTNSEKMQLFEELSSLLSCYNNIQIFKTRNNNYLLIYEDKKYLVKNVKPTKTKGAHHPYKMTICIIDGDTYPKLAYDSKLRGFFINVVCDYISTIESSM